jgi:DNA-binding transcriptional LysR family regulator
VWVAPAQNAAWQRSPLPVALYEHGCIARMHTLAALKARKIAYRVAYHSPSLAGQLAAVESGLAIAAITRCSAPPHLQILQEKHGLPALEAVNVALIRSKNSKGDAVVDALHEQVLRTLRIVEHPSR